MGPDRSRSRPPPSLSQLEEIDAICLRFEAAWQSSSELPPSLADFVDKEQVGPDQTDLLRELLKIDLAYRGHRLSDASLARCREEYPGFETLYDDLRESTTPSPEEGTQTVTRLESSLSPHTAPIPPVPSGLDREEFSGYIILERIAAGGMGVVDKAWQPGLNRVVALKRMIGGKISSPEERRRFRMEAEAAGRLQHPGIVPVFEVGEHDGQLFFSMGMVDGPSLKTRLAEHPLQPREAAELILKVARAVEYAHSQGIIHRDLKPANILLDARHEPLVTDFGLAKQMTAESGLTATGQVLGTPSYMPPEQAWGDSPSIGPTSDVYSLGATLYCTLTGRPPFQAASAVETINQVLTQDPVPPRQLNPLISVDLETICLKCLNKTPRQRYGSMTELAEELERFLAGRPILARPVGLGEQLWRWSRRNPVVSWLSVSTVLLLSLLSTVSTVAYFRVAGLVEEKDRLVIEEQKQSKRANTQAALADLRANQAREFANLAEQRRLAEAKQRTLADQRKDEAEFHNYVASIRLAAARWELDRIGDMRTALDEARPRSGGKDRRSWEWNYLWNLCHASVRSWQTAPQAVGAIRYSADGRTLLTANRGGHGDAWDLQTGARKERLSPEIAAQRSCFSPDGAWLAAGLPDGQVSIVDVVARTEAFRLTGHAVDPKLRRSSRILSLAFSRDGRLLATGSSDDMTVRLFDLGKREALHVLTVKGDPFGLAFSPDGSLLAVANAMGPEMTLWDTKTGTLAQTLLHRHLSVGVDFHPDGKELVSAGDYGRLMIWDLETGKEVVSVDAHREQFQSLCYSPDGRMIASGGSEGILLWNSETGERLQHLKGHPETVSSLAFSPDSRWLASGDQAGEVQIWSASAGIAPLMLDTSVDRDAWNGPTEVKPMVRELNFSDDGERLHTTSSRGYWTPRRTEYVSIDSDAQVWDLTSGALLQSYTSADMSVTAISPRGDLVLCSQKDGTRLLGWDAFSGRWRFAVSGQARLSPWDLFPWLINEHGFRAGGDVFAGRSAADTLAAVWKTDTGKEVLQLKGHTASVLCVGFNRAGDRIVTGCHDGLVRIWRTADGSLEQTLKGHRGIVTSACFSPEGDRVVSSSGMSSIGGRGDHSVRIWETSSGKELVLIQGRETPFSQVCFSADGLRVFGGTSAGTITLWDAETGHEILMINPFQNGTSDSLPHRSDTAISPDGGQIAVSRGHLVRILDGRPESRSRTRQVERAARGLLQEMRFGVPFTNTTETLLLEDKTLDEETRELALKRVHSSARKVTLSLPTTAEVQTLTGDAPPTAQ